MNIVKRYSITCFLCAVGVFQCGKDPVSPDRAVLNDMQKKVDALSVEVANLRGMSFLRKVKVGVISKQDYAASMSRNISNTLSGTEEEGLSKEYAQMGFLAETETPLHTILTDFYSSFPAAFYSIGTDSLTIITQSDYTDFQLNAIIAHELTHALLDQHLTLMLPIYPEYSSYNSDASLAQRALSEGDAMFNQYAYMFKSAYAGRSISPFDSSRKMMNDMKIEMVDETYSADEPIFLDVKSSVPYYFGAAYVATAYHDAGGWNAINDLYSISAVPRSSAEINRMSPQTVTYFDFHAIQALLVSQPGTIEFADDDNAGFALIFGLFYGDLDTASVGRSLDWRGDRYTFVKRAGQSYGTLVWSLAFADKTAADYLFGKLVKKIGSRRLAGKTATADSTVDSSGREKVYTFTSSSATTRIKRVDNQIWWLENTDTLTQRITDMLAAQKSGTVLAKATKSTSFPASLSAETKRQVIEGLIEHVFKRKKGEVKAGKRAENG
jgi:hypothetical protein